MKPLLVAFLLASSARAAVAVDATSVGTIQVGNGPTGVTWSHTIASGSGRLLVVTFGGLGVASTVATVTYGGVALTRSVGGAGWISEIWVLAAPTVGTANIVATWTAFNDTYFDISSTAISFTGADAALDTTGYTSGATTRAVTTTAAGCWLVGVTVSQNGALANSTGQTELNNHTTAGAEAASQASGYFGPFSAGSLTMTWSRSGGTADQGIAMIAIRPDTSPATKRRGGFIQ